jgi:hypothetical protein
MPIRLQPGRGSNPTYRWNVSAGNETFTLPKGFAAGRTIVITRTDSSGNTATVHAAPGDTLDGVLDGTALIGPAARRMFTRADPGAWESTGSGGGAGGAVSSVAGQTGDIAAATLATAVAAQAAFTGVYATLTGLGTKADANLSNVTASVGRTALGLGNSATRDVGTAANTVAAGNDSRWSNIVRSTTITTIVTLTQAAYDALGVKDPATLYVVTG